MDSFGIFKKRGKIDGDFNITTNPMIFGESEDLDELNFLYNCNDPENLEEILLNKYFNFTEPNENSSTDATEEPIIIKAVYETDLNLIHIHNIIRSKFIYEKRKLSQMADELEYLSTLICRDDISPIDVNCHKQRIDELKSTQYKILYGNIWEQYKNLSKHILLKYISVMSNKVKGILVIGKSITENEENISLRLRYIDQYLDVIRQLNIIELDVIQRIDNSLSCIVCNKPVANIEINDEGLYICSCGHTTSSLYSSSEYRDPSKIPNSGNTNTVAAFHKWINDYEGASGDNIDVKMFVDFDKWCLSNGYPTGEQIRNKNYISAFTPCLSFLIRIMSETKYSKFYNNKNLIRNLYWGWPLPSLEENIKKQAIERYIILSRFYQECKTRTSNLSRELLGYFILDSLGHVCYLCDFKIPNNPDTIEYTNNMLSIMCQKADVPFKKIIT